VKKAAAYDCLIEKLKVIEPDASRESVVKKLITFAQRSGRNSKR
jgi:hypothetical protein